MSYLKQAVLQALNELDNESYASKHKHIVEAIAILRAAQDQPDKSVVKEYLTTEPQTFHGWWNAGNLTKDNKYKKDTYAYWAWEGWHAAILLTTSPSQIAHSDACIEKEKE